MELISETTTNTAIVYQVNTDGKKHGYYRESVWNASGKFLTIYNPDEGAKQVLRPPDVIAEYTYVNDVLHGPWYILRQHVDSREVTGWILRGYGIKDIPLPERARAVGEYRNGLKQGIEREFSYGNLIRESHYHNGKLDGVVRKYYPTKTLMSITTYSKGKKHGNETHYTADGGIFKTYFWT